MKFEIELKESIGADKATVWKTINDLEQYSSWNPFVVKCQSTLDIGAPIIMWVKLIPGITLRQKETIFNKREGEFLEYGIRVPLLLKSSRQHIIRATSDSSCRYDSIFRLKGPLAPVVGGLLGKRLRAGFNGMTLGVRSESERRYTL